MELKTIMRQDKDQTEQLEMLKNLRIGHPTETDKDILLSLHLNSGNFSQQQIDAIMDKATFVFAKRKDMMEHNWQKLRDIHSSTNPVARIQTQTTSKGVKYNGRAKCIRKESDIDPILNICRGAKVQITGKNFEPDWGLFNGAVGKVMEIVYANGTSPLDGTFPNYVIVDIPSYVGPPWIKEHPTWVPIPPIETKCKKHCCSFKFIPLSLAFAKTGHTFQGQSVGPKHIIECIVVHPGNKMMELLCPGLLYMFASRPTTIGSSTDRSKSALFFWSNEMNRTRITNLTKTKNGKECTKILQRKKWVSYLRKNLCSIQLSTTERKEMIDWVNTVTVPEDIIHNIINDLDWRKSETLNY